jgi:DNA-binding NarL/FixJ family response regulator
MPRIVEAFATLSRETELIGALLAHRLSSREQAIVRQSALSNHEIVERLNLSEAPVKADRTHIFGEPPL